MSAIPLAGLVLAGGRSSRFGAEKAVQRLAGRSLMAWSLAALEEVCEVTAVSAPAGGEAATLALGLGCKVLADDPGHAAGPLAGVAAGLAWAGREGYAFLATLPCDTPLVSMVVMETLAAAAPAYAATADGPQALIAVWPTSAEAWLALALARGEHPAVREALAQAGAQRVLFEDATVFRNVNRPADLAALEAGL